MVLILYTGNLGFLRTKAWNNSPCECANISFKLIVICELIIPVCKYAYTYDCFDYAAEIKMFLSQYWLTFDETSSVKMIKYTKQIKH